DAQAAHGGGAATRLGQARRALGDHEVGRLVALCRALRRGLMKSSGAVVFFRRLLSRADNPLVRSVARVPAKVRTKLLVSFLAIAALLVVVAVLGVRALGQANSRGVGLKALQARAAGYQNLYAEASTFRDILGLCAGGQDARTWLNGGSSGAGLAPRRGCLRSIDRVVETALAGLGTAKDDLGFLPAPDERPYFREVRRDYRSLDTLVKRLKN